MSEKTYDIPVSCAEQIARWITDNEYAFACMLTEEYCPYEDAGNQKECPDYWTHEVSQK